MLGRAPPRLVRSAVRSIAGLSSSWTCRSALTFSGRAHASRSVGLSTSLPCAPPPSDPEKAAQQALCAAFRAHTQRGTVRPFHDVPRVAVRDLAGRLPDEVLEYVGEAHGGLAAYCRAKSQAGVCVVTASGEQLRVATSCAADGVTYVSLHPDGRAAGGGGPVRNPAGAAPRACASLSFVDHESAVLLRTLHAVFPSSPVTARALMERWGVDSVEEVTARVLALVTALAQWRVLARRHASRGRPAGPPPSVDIATGVVDAEAAARVAGEWGEACRSEGEAAAEGCRWDDLMTVVLRGAAGLVLVDVHRGRQPLPTAHTETVEGGLVGAAEVGRPQPYDLYRMAAFLTVGSPTPLPLLAQRCVAVMDFDPLHLALVFPDRVRMHVGGGTGMEGIDGWVLAVGPGRCRPIEGLSYILHTPEMELLKPNPALMSLTAGELDAAITGLKALKGSLKQSKQRRRYVRELFRRHFPKGNPFLHGEVVAQYLYDRMEPGRVYESSALREELLPGRGKDTMHVGVGFFHEYPHLFIVRGIKSTSSEVMRREQDMLDVHGDEALLGGVREYSLEDMHSWLLAGCFEDAARRDDGQVNMMLVYSQLLYFQRKAVRKRGSIEAFLSNFVATFPSVFAPAAGPMVTFNAAEASVLANKLALVLMERDRVRQKEARGSQ